jgi:rSAM/selenodomain-associated transferase 1
MARESGAAPARAVVVITAKAPIAGATKTRLAPALPSDRAAALHLALLTDTIRLVRSLPDVDLALICPVGHGAALASLFGDTDVVEQRGVGLAAALTDVFERFTAGGRPAIALNSDSPHLPAAALRAAVEALEHEDLVVGPTIDGGYYLVGARRAHSGLFTSDSLGTRNALTQLLERADILGLSRALCVECFDVDRPADLERMRRELREDAGRAPATAALLARWDAALP